MQCAQTELTCFSEAVWSVLQSSEATALQHVHSALAATDALFVEADTSEEIETAVNDTLFKLIKPLQRFDITRDVQVSV